MPMQENPKNPGQIPDPTRVFLGPTRVFFYDALVSTAGLDHRGMRALHTGLH